MTDAEVDLSIAYNKLADSKIELRNLENIQYDSIAARDTRTLGQTMRRIDDLQEEIEALEAGIHALRRKL